MAQYKLFLDESGSFAHDNDKYIVFGGVYYDIRYEQEIEEELKPIHKLMCETFECDELHASDNKKYFKYLCAVLGANDKIFPFVYVVDKKKSFIFDKYPDISSKYNKAMQWLIRRMISAGYLCSLFDEIDIVIDNINLNWFEENNLHDFLPSNEPVVKSVDWDDSRNSMYIQFSDIIANHFSKKSKCSLKDKEVKLLNPKFFWFLEETAEEYLIEDNKVIEED